MKPMVFTVVLLGLASAAQSDEVQTKAANQKLKAQVEDLTRRNAALKAQVESLQKSQNALSQALHTLKAATKASKNRPTPATLSPEATRQIKAALERARKAEAIASGAPLSDARFVTTTHDKAKDQTQIISTPYQLTMTHGTPQKHILHARAIFTGTQASKAKLAIVIDSGFTGQAYKTVKSVTFRFGDQTLSLPVVQYASHFRRSGGRNSKRIDDETITVAITATQLEALGGAVQATGKIGLNRFELTPEMLTALQAVQKRLDRPTASPSQP